ncbi:MAG: MarC family protein [Kiritimatiellae bacterium]|nr:MarC family protein [Kiritimatiellia bacterium]
MSVLSAAVTLFLIMDPLGNIPTFLTVLKDVDRRRHRRVILREMLIALGVLVVLLFVGPAFIHVLNITEPALSMAGGIILFLIALRMIFPREGMMFGDEPGGEPFIVPLAIPLIAGPSAIGTVILIVSREPARRLEWLAAIFLAWALSCVILQGAALLHRALGRRGLIALERLMGLLLTAIAVETFMTGVRQFLGA